jgi:hypothetical protein
VDDITIRLLCAAAGLVVGLLVGWTSRAARDARRVREHVMPGERTTTRWKPSASDLTQLMLVLVVLAGVISTVRVNARVEHLGNCTADVTTRMLQAANERTSYTEEVSQRTVELQTSQRQMITTMLDPSSSRDERRQALAGYAQALDAYTAVQKKSAAQRKAYPYPTVAEIERCR